MPRKPSCLCGECKVCTKREYWRKYRLTHDETARLRRRREDPAVRERDSAVRSNRYRADEEVRFKQSVRNALNHEVRRGRMVRASRCERCGNEGFTEAHHPDYRKPLSVEWLCADCHREADTMSDQTDAPKQRKPAERTNPVVEFVSELPTITRGPGAFKARSSKYDAVYAALKENPGRWACIGEGDGLYGALTGYRKRRELHDMSIANRGGKVYAGVDIPADPDDGNQSANSAEPLGYEAGDEDAPEPDAATADEPDAATVPADDAWA